MQVDLGRGAQELGKLSQCRSGTKGLGDAGDKICAEGELVIIARIQSVPGNRDPIFHEGVGPFN